MKYIDTEDEYISDKSGHQECANPLYMAQMVFNAWSTSLTEYNYIKHPLRKQDRS
jgi:hypothetical protein